LQVVTDPQLSLDLDVRDPVPRQARNAGERHRPFITRVPPHR
jgi:hypothetical protein